MNNLFLKQYDTNFLANYILCLRTMAGRVYLQLYIFTYNCKYNFIAFFYVLFKFSDKLYFSWLSSIPAVFLLLITTLIIDELAKFTSVNCLEINGQAFIHIRYIFLYHLH
jgi:hypothetical protein